MAGDPGVGDNEAAGAGDILRTKPLMEDMRKRVKGLTRTPTEGKRIHESSFVDQYV
jgi:hypothetical protein